MKTKTSKTAKIHAAIQAGESVKSIATRFKLKPQTVYTMRWKMNKSKPVARVTKVKAPEVSLQSELVRLFREEIMSIEHQIHNLSTIYSFLTIRLRQLEQNEQQ